MSDKKIQKIGLNKKMFMLDFDSSDEESIKQIRTFRPKIVQKNSKWVFEKKKIPEDEEIKEETDSDLDLSDLFGKPTKRVHRTSNNYATYCHNHSIYRVKPLQKRYFWQYNENPEKTLDGKSNHKRTPELPSEQDSSSEYVSEACIEIIKPIYSENENYIEFEENINFNEFTPENYEEETVEDSWHIKDVKAYLLDSDTEETNRKVVVEKKQKNLFNPFYNFSMEKLTN